MRSLIIAIEEFTLDEYEYIEQDVCLLAELEGKSEHQIRHEMEMGALH